MRRLLLVVSCLVGCLATPEFPLLDEIPVVGQSEVCAPPRDEVSACGVDGDTMDLVSCLSGERVRLIGVSAAETSSQECFAEEAAVELDRLVRGQRVRLSFDAECTDVTGSQRTLAYVWLMGDAALDRAVPNENDLDGIDLDHPFADDGPALLINEWLIARGYARVYPEERFGEPILGRRLRLAEAEAQRNRFGLWGACDDPDEALPPPKTPI